MKTKKTISTYWATNDKELPYVFDLLFDIKTLGQLWYSLVNDDVRNPAKDIEELMLENDIKQKDFSKLEFTKEFKEHYDWLFDNESHYLLLKQDRELTPSEKLSIANKTLKKNGDRLIMYNFELELVVYERFNGEFVVHDIWWTEYDSVVFENGDYFQEKDSAIKKFFYREKTKYNRKGRR